MARAAPRVHPIRSSNLKQNQCRTFAMCWCLFWAFSANTHFWTLLTLLENWNKPAWMNRIVNGKICPKISAWHDFRPLSIEIGLCGVPKVQTFENSQAKRFELRALSSNFFLCEQFKIHDFCLQRNRVRDLVRTGSETMDRYWFVWRVEQFATTRQTVKQVLVKPYNWCR